MPVTGEALKSLSISSIAAIVRADWKNPYFGAVPYINSMLNIHTHKDEGFGFDMPNEQVIYFLSNASTYKGEQAREIKKELKRRIK